MNPHGHEALSAFGEELNQPYGMPTQQQPKKKKKKKRSRKPKNRSPIVDASSRRDSAEVRSDSSLGILTRRFVSLLRESGNGILDLNYAAEKLEVQKRRIYDITNVLEGIGLIEKNSKNNIKWRGKGWQSQGKIQADMMQLEESIKELQKEDAMLDDYISRMNSMLKDFAGNESNQAFAYLTYEDISKLQEFNDKTVIGIRAPSGTTLNVPDPSEAKADGYELYLRSSGGPIDIYLVSAHEADMAVESAAVHPLPVGNIGRTMPPSTPNLPRISQQQAVTPITPLDPSHGTPIFAPWSHIDPMDDVLASFSYDDGGIAALYANTEMNEQ